MDNAPLWLQDVLATNKPITERQNNSLHDRTLTGDLSNPEDIRKRTQWNNLYKQEINSLIDGFISGTREIRPDYCSHLINLLLEHGKLSTTDKLKLGSLQRIQSIDELAARLLQDLTKAELNSESIAHLYAILCQKIQIYRLDHSYVLQDDSEFYSRVEKLFFTIFELLWSVYRPIVVSPNSDSFEEIKKYRSFRDFVKHKLNGALASPEL